ncbi:MAG: HAMP domain-containing histidine kinase [Lachnospiraceae bacterium]|nr:HAMP domain-containing histidine kinase [Lachnospiraceae bacterium]
MIKEKLSSHRYDMTIFKIFISIVLISSLVAILLFGVNFLGTGSILSNGGEVFPNNPRGILEKLSAHFEIVTDETGGTVSFTLTDETVVPENYWCILLDQEGDIVWSLHKPADIPDHYSLNDIAALTRWYLNDYPVYVRVEDYGLFILGIPKNAVGKYSIEYTMNWFATLPRRILHVFILNFIFASLLSSVFGSFLYKKIKLLTEGLAKLRREEAVSLPARGIFKEPFSDITKTSQSLARKNAQLANRDKARSNWISGISHDIRTPLSMVVGYGEQLAEDPELSEEQRKYAAIITAQGLKIKKLIEDLNLISSLEYEMQPRNKKPVQIAVLLRSVVGEILNSDLISFSSPEQNSVSNAVSALSHQLSEKKYDISLSLHCGQAVILGDESLLARAFYNLLHNSITHNEQGCLITVSASLQAACVSVVIADNGQGVPDQVLKNLDTLPGTAHGFGLPMVCKIIRAHGGTFRAENRDGFVVTMELPVGGF